MSAGNLIFLLLFVGGFLAMFSMHRGGHGASGGMGGCCGGHSHDTSEDREQSEHPGGGQTTKLLLGPPGTQSSRPAAMTAPARRDH